MTLLALRDFSGISPKTPPGYLKENQAQWAENCDFAHGDLRGMDGLFAITSASVPVRSLYSDNGVRFAAWNADVDAVSSPQPNDEHHRFYYSEGGYIKAAFANMLSLTPGPPNTIKRVGVIAPTNPPTTEVVDSDKLPLGATTITAVGWYESSGQRFQSGEVFLSPIVFGRKYTALLPVKYQSTPAKAGDTPESAVACIQISGKRDGITLFTITGDTSSAASKTTAIPGGATLSVVSAGETVVATIDYGEIEARSYLYTHVNLYGEESAPSEPTSIAMDAMQRIYVHANFVPAPAEYFQLTKIRLYRTNTASSGYTKYQFVKDQGVNAGGDIKILDDVENGSLGEICETENWFSPPDGLNGLINLGNGILVAFRGNELHFCEAYVPYAWSPFNVVTLPYQIVGLCPHSGGFVAVTAANPYLVSGVSSDAMTASMLPAMQGGISKRAIANLGDSVVYASNDGLVAVAGGNSSLEFSQLFWSRHDWRADWAVSALQLAAHDGCIIGFLPSGKLNFIARLDESAGSLTYFDQWGSGAFVVPNMDGLYFAQGNQIYRFTGSGAMPFVWHSKDFILKKPENFGVAQIVLGKPEVATNVKIEFFADGEKVYEKQIAESGGYHTFRLPSGFMARRWSFKFTGTGRITEFFVATAGVELGDR